MRPELRALITKAYLRRLAASSKPILLGPWRSEVGFEAMYYLPFLRWFVKAYGVDPKRLIAVTRGGASVLYGTAAIDLYRLRSVDEVRLENQFDWQRSKLQKQTGCTEWDRDVLKSAAAQILGRGETYNVLHPSWMYWTLAPWWDEQRGLTYLANLTDFEPIRGIAALAETLPSSYVAMKWYDRATLPLQSEKVQALIGEVVSVIGAQSKIVLLAGTPEADDHVDASITHPSIVTVPAGTPDQNLARQIQILAHASAFIGTYGGMAQLALRLGIPSASFYESWGQTAHAHLALSSILSKKTNVPFLCGSVDDAQGWKKVLSVPMAAMQPQALTTA